MIIYSNMTHNRTTHGFSGSPTYTTWVAMRQRCNNKNSKDFQYYGARDINVCESWESFSSFLEDMGERPSKDHSIDRINVNGDYEPSNCRWVYLNNKGDNVQSNNKTSTLYITVDGTTLSATQWAKELGLKPGLVIDRLRLGWTPYESLGLVCRFTPEQELASYIKGLHAKGQLNNQAALARLLGKSKSFVSRIVNGSRYKDVPPNMLA